MRKSDLLPKSGIYLIINRINHKKYVGKDKLLPRRWENHKYNLRLGKHSNPHLQHTWDLYGEDIFTYEILEYCEKEYLIGREKWWITLLNAMEPSGYNMRDPENGNLGMAHSVEAKAKLSAILKGKPKPPRSEEHRSNLSISHKGQIPWNKGKKGLQTAWNKDLKGSMVGEDNPFYGEKHTEEAKARMSAAKKGKPWTEAQRKARPIPQSKDEQREAVRQYWNKNRDKYNKQKRDKRVAGRANN